MARSIRTGYEESLDQPSSPIYYRMVIYIILAFIVGFVVYRSWPALIVGSPTPVKLVVYGFSTQEEVFNLGVFPEFEKIWESKNGRDLIIEGVFGPSGTLANQIILGAPADIAILSNDQHVNWLKIGRQVDQNSKAVQIGCTPIVIVTRPGNPAKIEDFADLSTPSINLIHAAPGQSGAGEWAIMAEYGSIYFEGGDKEAAEAQVKSIWNNITVLGASAREILTMFELGAGDAIVTYEQDALLALDRGVPLSIVIPRRTIIAQHMVVIIDSNVAHLEEVVAQDFVHFLLSERGQAILTQYHMRSPEITSAGFASITNPFTIEDIGGWSQAYHDLVDELWKQSMAPQQTTKPLPSLLDGRD